MVSEATIRGHYQRITDSVAPLGALAENPTVLVNDKTGWYVTCSSEAAEYIIPASTATDIDPSDEYDTVRRARNFTTDYQEVTSTHVKRTLYALTSYKQPEAFTRWEPATFNQSTKSYEYKRQKPAPQLADITAIAAWGDVDLADELKTQRPSLDTDTYATIEATIDAYIEAFAALYGGREAIYALDSVGGAYLFGAPEATLPIAQHFSTDDSARERAFDAFIERSNDYLRSAEQQINEIVDGAQEVIHPDWVNNHNRQYKLPLSLHSDLDYVVTPIDITEVEYREPVSIDAVDEALLDDVQAWCESYTSVEYEDRVASLVATLWPDEFEESEDWQTALEMWVDAERTREQEAQRRREQARKRRQQRQAELDDGLEGTLITPHLIDVHDAIDALDIEDVAGETIVHQWTDSVSGKADNSGSGKRAFIPIWRTSSNGTACYVDEKGSWNDTKEDYYGTAVEAALIGTGHAHESDGPASGQDWVDGVTALRTLGFEIPIWTPEAGSQRRDGGTYDQMPFWAVRKAAVALERLPEDAFIERKTDDGSSTYLGFPGARSYNTALDAIEDAGLRHNRERASTSSPSAPDTGSTPDQPKEQSHSAATNHSSEPSRAALIETVRALTDRLEETTTQIAILRDEVERLEAALAEREERIEELEAITDSTHPPSERNASTHDHEDATPDAAATEETSPK